MPCLTGPPASSSTSAAAAAFCSAATCSAVFPCSTTRNVTSLCHRGSGSTMKGSVSLPRTSQRPARFAPSIKQISFSARRFPRLVAVASACPNRMI